MNARKWKLSPAAFTVTPIEMSSFRARTARFCCCAAFIAATVWTDTAVATPPTAGILTVSGLAAAGTAPDTLLIATTQSVIAVLRQSRELQMNNPGRFADTIELHILPLFDFDQMTQLAMAGNWPLASPEQQRRLIAEFKALLVRGYSSVLANYRNQTIRYLPLHREPGQTQATVKSTIRPSGAEPVAIDYGMEKTAAGWKVCDIKLNGISLIATYQADFAQAVSDVGVDGLIKALRAKNSAGNARPRPTSGRGGSPRHEPLA